MNRYKKPSVVAATKGDKAKTSKLSLQDHKIIYGLKKALIETAYLVNASKNAQLKNKEPLL